MAVLCRLCRLCRLCISYVLKQPALLRAIDAAIVVNRPFRNLHQVHENHYPLTWQPALLRVVDAAIVVSTRHAFPL